MKKVLSILLVLALALSLTPTVALPALAVEDSSGLWEWRTYGGGVELTSYKGDQTDVFVPAKVEAGGESYAVVKLGDGLFRDNASLNSATLGEGILEIGANAFAGATGLVCIVTPESLTTVGTNAFAGCTTFNSVVLYDAVTTIGAGAFEGCAKLTVYCNENTPAHQYAQANGVTFVVMNPSAEPEIVEEGGITYYIMNGSAVAIEADADLTDVTIPAVVEGYPVTELRETFLNHGNIGRVIISNGVKTIGTGAFQCCPELTQVTIPDSVTTIGNYAFMYCHALEQVTIPDGVTTIGDFAFDYCTTFENIAIPDSVTFIGSNAFANCEGLTQIIIPAGVKTIKRETFASCVNLTEVTIPESVTAIDTRAFYYCKNLSSIAIPDRVTRISYDAFEDCTSLKKIAVPASVNFIDGNPFPSSTVWLVAENSYAHRFAQENDCLYLVYDGVTEPEIFEQDGITYVVMNGNAIAIGADASLTDVVIPATAKGYPVTELRATFKGNRNIKSVVIPNGVTTIGNLAFEGCDELKQVNIPDGVTTIGASAFEFCFALENITIPDTVTSIGERAFSECYGFTQITIPAGVKDIERRTFGNCHTVTEIIIPDGVKTIGCGAFGACASLTDVTIPDSVTTISSGAFDGCPSLKKVVVPASVERMDIDSFPNTTVWLVTENSYAHRFAQENNCLYLVYDGVTETELFEESGITYCILNGNAIAIEADAGLTDVTIPAAVKGYPVTELRGTFGGNENLKSVVISNGVTKIGDGAFSYCSTLERVVIPDSVTTIGVGAFSLCLALEQVTIPDSVTTIGVDAFGNCSALKQMTIPERVTQIGARAFFCCYALEQVTIPGSVKTIENDAFAGCNNLSEITISEGVTTIDVSAFGGCKNLTSVTIPDSVTAIDGRAFEGCTGLRKIVVPTSVDTITNGNPFPDAVVWIVTEGSYAHRLAQKDNYLHFVLPKSFNPEIAYGTEITGKVTYTDGSAAANVDVEILYDDGTVKEQVKTDETGNYELTYAEVGRYTVRAVDERGNSQSERVSVKRMNAFDVFLAGETDLVLKRGYTVSGTVSPAAATVTLTDTEGRTVATIETSNGTYALADIPNGSYLLKAENQTGSVVEELRVYNADVTADLVVPATAAAITGTVKAADREGGQSPKAWAQVSVYDGQGVLIAQTRSDGEGKFAFANVPPDGYAIVAEATEMRPDAQKGYERSHTLTGYGYIEAAEAKAYDVGVIVLYEETEDGATFLGKVTANGQTQDSTVTVVNAFGSQVATMTTGRNGKYTFTNIPDGMYVVTAVTTQLGTGSTTVVVRGGQVYGETDIRVYKTDKVTQQEETSDILNIPAEEAAAHKEALAAERETYESLTDTERQQFSAEYLEQMNALAEAAVDYSAQAPVGFAIENGGMLVTAEEINAGSAVALELTAQELPAHEIPAEGIQTGEDFVQQMIEDEAGEAEIAAYYDLALSKNGQTVSDVEKQTDSTGQLRITMDIPAEHLGHANYSIVHVHNGETTTLVDLDDDPSTVTFKLDQFSTCALAYSDVVLTQASPLTLDPSSVTAKLGQSATVTATVEGGKIQTITATPENAEVVTAAVAGNTISLTPVAEGKTTVAVSVGVEGQVAPLTDTITVEVVGGEPDSVDKTPLAAAIATAEGVYAGDGKVEVKPTGTRASEVPNGQKFVTESDKTTLAAAITAAKTVADDENATEAQVPKAVNDLTAAVDTFNKAIQTGTKTSSQSSSGGGGGGVSQPSGGGGGGGASQPSGGAVPSTTAVKFTDSQGNTAITVSDASGTVLAKVELPAQTPALDYTFADVPADHWAKEAINAMAALGIVKGVSTESHVFDMDSNVTRAALAQILYNLSQGKAGMGESFADVAADAWYTDAIAWAAKAGIVTGYSDSAFGPDDSITREQLALMLYRYAKLLGLDTAVQADMAQFADSSAVSGWATEAMTWAVAKGLLQGRGAGNLDPAASASRAETAVVFQRLLTLLK